jgi:hypothetical protein
MLKFNPKAEADAAPQSCGNDEGRDGNAVAFACLDLTQASTVGADSSTRTERVPGPLGEAVRPTGRLSGPRRRVSLSMVADEIYDDRCACRDRFQEIRPWSGTGMDAWGWERLRAICSASGGDGVVETTLAGAQLSRLERRAVIAAASPAGPGSEVALDCGGETGSSIPARLDRLPSSVLRCQIWK